MRAHPGAGLSTLIVAILAGCAAAAGTRDDPLAVIRAQEEAWNRGDIEAFMDGYHRSDDTTFSSDQGTVRGWQAVLDRYRKRYPDRAAMGKLSFGRLESRSLGDGAALVTGEWRLERERDAPGGVFSLAMRLFPEGWRIVHDHTSASAR
jgi:beta-aspartyl-peptidase (threonine type)